MKDAHSWLGSVSDMMSGLMMIFLLIAVAFMLEMQKGRQDAEGRAAAYLEQGETIRKIAATYSELQVGLYQDLLNEFRDDLPKWNATIEADNTVRFNEPEVLFETGKSALKNKFKVILDDFFPCCLSPVFMELVHQLFIKR